METTQNYLSIINPNALKVGVEASDKDSVFEYISRMLLEDGVLSSVEEFKKDLYAREALGKTGIGSGIAIPHGKSAVVSRTCISIIKLASPIEWETTDGKPVQVIILFAVSLEDKNNNFLRMMAQVARKLANEATCHQLLEAETPQEILDALA